MTDLFQTSGTSPTDRTTTEPDFVVEDYGSIFLLRALTSVQIPGSKKIFLKTGKLLAMLWLSKPDLSSPSSSVCSGLG